MIEDEDSCEDIIELCKLCNCYHEIHNDCEDDGWYLG